MPKGAGYALYYWLKTYVVILSFSAIFLMLLWALGIESQVERMSEIYGGRNSSDKITFPFIISTLILAPLLEEISFRLPLKDFKRNFLLSFMALTLLIALSHFTEKKVGFILLILGVIYTLNWLLLLRKRINVNISRKAIYILSMVFFVLAHFGTIEVLHREYQPIYILFGAHMTICAYFLSKIRLNGNVYYSMLLHFLYNLVPVLVLVF